MRENGANWDNGHKSTKALQLQRNAYNESGTRHTWYTEAVAFEAAAEAAEAASAAASYAEAETC